MSDRDNSSGLMWFLAGLGLGALVGVLYAPKSGQETRQAIRDAADEGREYLTTKGRDAREHAGKYAERGREVLSQKKEQFKAATDAFKQVYREANEGKS